MPIPTLEDVTESGSPLARRGEPSRVPAMEPERQSAPSMIPRLEAATAPPAPSGIGPGWSHAWTRLGPVVLEAADRLGVPVAAIWATLWDESRGQATRRGPDGEVGPMQIMPRWFGTVETLLKSIPTYFRTRTDIVEAGIRILPNGRIDLQDPHSNILVGTAYLGHLLRRFGGDLSQALVGYNVGEPTLRRAVTAKGAGWLGWLEAAVQRRGRRRLALARQLEME